jgi:hypothetical protein
MYKIQEENVVTEGGGKYNNPRGFNQGNQGGFGRGRGRTKLWERRKRPHNML